MKRKTLILVAIIFLTFTIIATAAINGEYRGFPIVNVRVNGLNFDMKIPAINFYGKTMLPVRDIGEALNAAIAWDGDTWTVDLVKPEIEMLFIEQLITDEDGKDTLVNPFKATYVGNKSFQLYLLMNKLTIGTHTYRVVIADPNGEIIKKSDEYNLQVDEKNIVGFYQTISYDDIPLDKTGDYYFRFQLKIKDSFRTVHEKSLTVLEEQ
ncbi:hypothetical protein F8154_08285 [Alkaliphilus pronyensis]|uniref:Copper amine oxidase-like N-terminal domain-containing protein n=1 Tax=Alkaliphilus pronyensis TaxID=1482732 RepID=A0A6I0F826_9FIRM|nr:stalk domain-containing protein [Alkaliphilus pronyensis]KAB3534713.1 hypothetical protein F8154_08285 [Alkaliphilus pronyensis]